MTLPRKLRGGYPSAPSLPIRLCPIFRSSTRFQGNLEQILEWPYARAMKALKLFPSIGDPGAEKILLFCGVAAGLPLESNGLRVLTRIGYGRAHLRNYGVMYRSVQEDLAPELPKGAERLARAHLLLRLHGKTICRDSRPECHECPPKMPAPSEIPARPEADEIFLEQGTEAVASHVPGVANGLAAGPRAEDLVPTGVGRVFSAAAVLEIQLEIHVFHELNEFHAEVDRFARRDLGLRRRRHAVE